MKFLAVGWTAAISIIFLFHHDAWLYPATLIQNLPVISVGPHLGDYWLRRLADAGWCFAVLATAFATGHVFLRERTLLTGLYAIAIGLWIMATGVMVIGLFSTAHVRWIFLLAGCWLYPRPRFRKFVWHPDWLWIILGLAGGLCLLNAMTPPFEYDELEYHLGSISEYHKAGRIIFLPHNFYSNLPQLTEMLYLLIPDIAAKMLHWCFGVLSATAIYAVAEKLWSRRVGLLAAALFYCMPYVQDLSQTARIDLATAFYATLAFGGVLLAYDGTQWVRLAAITAGMAVATKWTAIPVVVFPCVAGLLMARRFSLWFALGPVPWLVKNWLLAGNPVYPLWSNSVHWTAEQAAVFAAKHYPHGISQFFERLWHYSFVEPGALPILLMTAPLALLVRGNNRLRRAGLLFGAAYLCWFAFTFRPWRFLFPAFPLAAAIGACALDSVGKWCRPIVIVIWLTGLAWMGLMADGRLAAGQVTEKEFITQLGNGVYEPIFWMNDNLPASARVLYVGEARTHYSRHQVIWATAFDQFPKEVPTHVYINPSELKRLHTNYGYPRGLDLEAVQRHCGRELHRGVFEWVP